MVAVAATKSALAHPRSWLQTRIEDLPLSRGAKAELRNLAPAREALRLRDVLTLTPNRVSEEVRTFVQQQDLAFALSESELAEYQEVGYVSRIRFGSANEFRARSELSYPALRLLMTLGDPPAKVLAETYDVQSLSNQPGVTDKILRELRNYARSAGHPIPFAGGYGEEYMKLSTRARSALRRLGLPPLAKLQDLHSRTALARKYGERVATEIAEFTAVAGYPLREEGDRPRMSQHTQYVLQALGVPTPERLAREYTFEYIKTLPNVGPVVLAELTSYIRSDGRNWRDELVDAGPFARLSLSVRKFLAELGDPSPGELHERETISSLIGRGAEPAQVREIYIALKGQGFVLDAGPDLKPCGSYLVGNGMIYVLE